VDSPAGMVAGKDKTNPTSRPERTTGVNGAGGDAQMTSRWPDGIRVALNGAGVLRGGRQDRDKENEG
jgi:hypothetical protein